MKRNLLIIFCLSLFNMQICLSQTSVLQTTAINEALGNTSATLSNYGSVFSNVAGLAEIKEVSIAASYKVIPNALWQNTMSASSTVPIKFGTVGLGFTRLGDDIFNQQVVSMGFANRFGIASIGIKANYLQYSIEGFNSKSIPFFDLGGIVELTPQLFIGAYIINLTQTKLSTFQNERFPTIIDAGISFRPTDKLMINVEVEQDIDFSPTLKAGIGYSPIKNFSLRTGINTSPNRQYFGLGFIPNNILLHIDYSLSNDSNLGVSHQMSISYGVLKPTK
ncbi:MAG: hypothetical protein OEW67_15440 [Cyclobacteriaceae bacterium]|nr:hypothetical protein [Cyclobacteriaceae bacterium]